MSRANIILTLILSVLLGGSAWGLSIWSARLSRNAGTDTGTEHPALRGGILAAGSESWKAIGRINVEATTKNNETKREAETLLKKFELQPQPRSLEEVLTELERICKLTEPPPKPPALPEPVDLLKLWEITQPKPGEAFSIPVDGAWKAKTANTETSETGAADTQVDFVWVWVGEKPNGFWFSGNEMGKDPEGKALEWRPFTQAVSDFIVTVKVRQPETNEWVAALNVTEIKKMQGDNCGFGEWVDDGAMVIGQSSIKGLTSISWNEARTSEERVAATLGGLGDTSYSQEDFADLLAKKTDGVRGGLTPELNKALRDAATKELKTQAIKKAEANRIKEESKDFKWRWVTDTSFMTATTATASPTSP